MIWSPRPHVIHAWQDVKTVWGKIALVVFYSLIWVSIIGYAIMAIFPYVFGNRCLIDSFEGGNEVVAVAFLRNLFIIMVGFFCYADVGGLKVKNVAMVTTFLLAGTLSCLPAMHIMKAECTPAYTFSMTWLPVIWAGVALLLAIMEDKLGDHGSSDERTPLTS